MRFLLSARIVVLATLLSLPVLGFGQGCSDAGFCTMGAMRPDQAYNKNGGVKLRYIDLTYYRGTSLLSAIIQSVTLDINIGFNTKSSFQIKTPYQWVNGNLGENSGFGDISLSYSRVLLTSHKWSLNGSLGAKIPSGNGNKTVNNKNTGFQDAPIHTYYQNSLGSYDAIAGLSVINRKWLLATGIQIALTQNENQFTWEDGQNGFPDYPSRSYLQEHDVARELKRGIDVMFRAERNWRFTKFNFSIGALPIWRITKDTGIAIGETEKGKLDGTTGLALSAIGSFGYHFDVNHAIKVVAGLKLMDREFNPDGLTRGNVLNISYQFNF